MCFNSGNCRDTYYCEDSRALNDCTDCAFCEDCQLCYECVDCNSCYNSNYCQDSANCEDIHFSYDLRRCKHCIGCVGLRDKQYYIFNEKKSESEYKKALKTLDMSNSDILKVIDKKLEKIKKKTPRMFVHQFDTQNCTGDYIYHSKNCHMCFDTRHTEDSGYINQANLEMGTKDSWDCGPIPTGMDLCYDIAYAHYLFNCQHLHWCGNLKDCKWTTCCMESKNLFGCNYLKHKDDGYYILNQKVDEDFYKKTTKAIDKELRKAGIFTFYDLINKNTATTHVPNVVEGSGDAVGDADLHPQNNELTRNCTLCKNEFKIIDKEIKFYKKMDIEYPIYCPDCRAKQRVGLRNDRTMYKRKCDKCKNTLITTYPSDSPYVIYCLDCWLNNFK